MVAAVITNLGVSLSSAIFKMKRNRMPEIQYSISLDNYGIMDLQKVDVPILF